MGAFKSQSSCWLNLSHSPTLSLPAVSVGPISYLLTYLLTYLHSHKMNDSQCVATIALSLVYVPIRLLPFMSAGGGWFITWDRFYFTASGDFRHGAVTFVTSWNRPAREFISAGGDFVRKDTSFYDTWIDRQNLCIAELKSIHTSSGYTNQLPYSIFTVLCTCISNSRTPLLVRPTSN